MTPTTIAIVILVLAGLAVLVFLVVSSRRRRRGIEDIPPGMRPGYSDEQLEKSVLERTMGWGVVLTLFFAVFFPVYWLNETRRLPEAQESMYVEKVAQGQQNFEQFCAECHGSDATGGAAPAPDGEGSWPAPNLTNIVARYEDNTNVDDMERFLYDTIEAGRPGTPMPEWGMAFGGPLTDEEIDGIVQWLLANQVDPEEEDAVAEADPAAGKSGEELFTENCARCHGEDLQGGVAPSLISVFERHSEDQIMTILRGGIVVPTGANMPPWQEGYMYPDARYTDEALASIVDYLRAQQPSDGENAGDESQQQATEASGAHVGDEDEASEV